MAVSKTALSGSSPDTPAKETIGLFILVNIKFDSLVSNFFVRENKN